MFSLKPGRKGFTFPPGFRHILFLWHPVPLTWLGARAHSAGGLRPPSPFSRTQDYSSSTECEVCFCTCWDLTLAFSLTYFGQVSIYLSFSLPGIRTRTSFSNRSVCTWPTMEPDCWCSQVTTLLRMLPSVFWVQYQVLEIQVTKTTHNLVVETGQKIITQGTMIVHIISKYGPVGAWHISYYFIVI